MNNRIQDMLIREHAAHEDMSARHRSAGSILQPRRV
jgi:hypothetical protein